MANELENLTNSSEHMAILVAELVRDVHAKRISAKEAIAMLDGLITVADSNVIGIPNTTLQLLQPCLDFFKKARTALVNLNHSVN